MRLPPPNVRWSAPPTCCGRWRRSTRSTARPVPHCSVKWSGDDPQWFGCPYFIVPKLEGSVMAFADNPWLERARS